MRQRMAGRGTPAGAFFMSEPAFVTASFDASGRDAVIAREFSPAAPSVPVLARPATAA
jgi:hypothetical protein